MGRYKFDKFGGEYLSESTIKGIAADLCKNANINRYLYDWAVLEHTRANGIGLRILYSG